MPDPPGPHADRDLNNGIIRLSLRDQGTAQPAEEGDDEDMGESSDDEVEKVDEGLKFRLVNRDDPEAYSFNTPQYSAHKLPKDVVDAGVEGPAGLSDFMERWRDIVRNQGSELP